MAAWLPILKTALPYVTQILSVAIPAFTSKTDDKKTDEIISTQITELQSAVTQNSESVKVLAEQLKETIQGMDKAAINLQEELTLLKRICMFSLIIAVISSVVALWAVVR